MSLAAQPTSTTGRWVTIERCLEASPSRVYRGWSDPDEMARWFSIKVEGSLAVDARTILTWHDRRIGIDVIEADPDRAFRFRWHWRSDDSYVTEVAVVLKPLGYGTQLRLTDGPFDVARPGILDAYAEALEGWGQALAALRAHVDFAVDIRDRC